MQAVWLTRAALPHLSDSHGSIIAISSGSGIHNYMCGWMKDTA